MNVEELVQRSFEAAKATRTGNDTKKYTNRQRSEAFVDELSSRFSQFYQGPCVRVFSRRNPSNYQHFGLNELLHDICICTVATVPSPRHKRELYYIQDVLWQVESEFARDGRQEMGDFNKLVLGSAHHKLCIMSPLRDPDPALQRDVFIPAAAACSGRVYLALVPHPNDWDELASEVEVWEFERGTEIWQSYR